MSYFSLNPCRAKIHTYFVVKYKNLNKLVDAGWHSVRQQIPKLRTFHSLEMKRWDEVMAETDFTLYCMFCNSSSLKEIYRHIRWIKMPAEPVLRRGLSQDRVTRKMYSYMVYNHQNLQRIHSQLFQERKLHPLHWVTLLRIVCFDSWEMMKRKVVNKHMQKW